MIINRPILHYARLTLEARTAHGIHSGQGDITHDVLLVRDANGLPALPATSLAGVLRHLYTDSYGQASSERLFGQASGKTGQPSWITFTWGLVHDDNDRALEGLRDDLDSDLLLQHLTQTKPLVRQRVRLNARGSVADKGKFDVTLIPAGTRYTCFLSYWSDGGQVAEDAWTDLLALLAQPGFRLGNGTRGGTGAFAVHDLRTACWDLRTAEGRAAYERRPRHRAQHQGLTPYRLSHVVENNVLNVQLSLRAEAGWRVGGGECSLSHFPGDKAPDLLPQSEPVIVWEEGKGHLSQRYPLLPATAVKGALAHRLAYHYRRLTRDWAGSGQLPNEHLNCPAVQTLFGQASDNGQGQIGQVVIDDLYLDDTQVARQMHNRIDRFTGGVINGALFEEELLWQTPLTLILTLPDSRRRESLSSVIRRALNLTLEDLGRGWLPLGTGGSRGQGVFIGTEQPCWSDGGHWCRASAIEKVSP